MLHLSLCSAGWTISLDSASLTMTRSSVELLTYLLLLHSYTVLQSADFPPPSAESAEFVNATKVQREFLYLTFDERALSTEEHGRWHQGTPCQDLGSHTLPNGSKTVPLGLFYCPMPFEEATFTQCCTVAEHQGRCCVSGTGTNGNLSVVSKWGIGFGVVAGCFSLGMLIICFFNKCTRWCTKTNPDDTPRPKLKISGIKLKVKPVDKRVLLKTGNYSVEQSWEEITVRFYNQEFYDKFRDALLRKYKELSWRDPRKEQAGVVTCAATGAEVSLHMQDDLRSLLLTEEGNVSWVMNDFQNICKNVKISDGSERRYENPNPKVHHLSPRLPTIGEEFFDAGDYNVKISQTEVEIKFIKECLFAQFKRVLLYRYPTLPWSKYLQRDCAQISLESGKNVTIHLWEDIRSVWLSGDGKKDWYNKEFQEVYADAAYGQLPGDTVSKSRPQSATSGGKVGRKSPGTLSRGSSQLEIPATYTVKTLDAGGFEIEFPSPEFITEMKSVLEVSCRSKGKGSVTWSEYSYRHVTKLKTESGKSVTVHLGSPSEQPRKMWIYDEPGCKEWFNGEFKQLYTVAYENIHKIDNQSSHSSQPSDTDSAIAPVEHTL